MKQKNQISILISTIILIGILATLFLSFSTYSSIIRDDILNISKLSSTNIYSEIDNELTKPIFVGLTMANDTFVKNWLVQESTRADSEIVSYLEGIRNKYHYHSVFLVSDRTKKYFHYNGLFKTLSSEDQHDVWYHDFSNQNKLYILDVDQDEVDHQLLTIFVNCKILDDSGRQLGVTGVGVEMGYVQNLLLDFEQNYQLEAFLVDENGLVQAHTNAPFIENRNINDEALYKNLGQRLYNKTDSINVFDGASAHSGQYIISHYIEELDWYLVVRKDTSILTESFNKQLYYDFFIISLVLASVIFIVTQIIKKHEKQLNEMALVDSLGILTNRKGFDKRLKELLAKNEAPWSVFMMDLDHFKQVNDLHGHIQGDKILKHVMTISKNTLSDHLITRWGGDELSGIIYTKAAEAESLLEKLRQTISSDVMLIEFNITVSIGVSEATTLDTEDTIIKRADKALYQAKSEGKNQVVRL
ncbi:sensor domain-containing diguanylate cyclase [Fusibacter sp. 3D3]|uniref:sensor domain-containing diguanylate cyclase n=1 Tax=Fusibacter sp. 3D3 TaxID=1048380 RepID=UPI000852A927|nr:sensor domain-containing diguanylate cyclase [Fusibacter sp. 3D3]GAU75811.1 GGDEF/response regulator receiver domain protein [Fusibacter sp. 3D3]